MKEGKGNVQIMRKTISLSISLVKTKVQLLFICERVSMGIVTIFVKHYFSIFDFYNASIRHLK